MDHAENLPTSWSMSAPNLDVKDERWDNDQSVPLFFGISRLWTASIAPTFKIPRHQNVPDRDIKT